MKKGIALFSTLMILVLVVMLMSVALKNSTNITQSTLKDRYLIQENLTMTDALRLFENQVASKLVKKKGKEKIELQKVLFSTPLQIRDTVTNSLLEIKMIPNDGKLNINLVNNNDNTIKNYIQNVFSKIGVKEPDILKDILLANITNNDKYRDDYKVPIKQLDKSFGMIESFNQFEEMLLIYAQNTDDSEVLDINFQKYFNFFVEVENNGKKKYTSSTDCKLDINYAELELIDALVGFPNSIRQMIKEKTTIYSLPWDDDVSPKIKSILENIETNNIILKINTTSINNKVEYTLNYNLKTKKISKISMDRWIY